MTHTLFKSDDSVKGKGPLDCFPFLRKIHQKIVKHINTTENF